MALLQVQDWLEDANFSSVRPYFADIDAEEVDVLEGGSILHTNGLLSLFAFKPKGGVARFGHE